METTSWGRRRFVGGARWRPMRSVEMRRILPRIHRIGWLSIRGWDGQLLAMASPRSAFVHRIARRIASVRVERGMTQEQLASRLEIATKNVQRLESGRQNLTLATIERIAGALGVAPETFFGAAPSVESKHRANGAEVRALGGRGITPAVGKSTERARGGAAATELAELSARGFVVTSTNDGGSHTKSMVPLVSLRAAAGRPKGGARAPERLGWIALDRTTAPPEGQFVAQVRGQSMEPRIPDGALVLFGPPAPGSLEGRVFLLEQPELADPALGGPYVVKRIARIDVQPNGTRRVTLRSDNRGFADRVVVVRGDEELRVVAEVVRVLARAKRRPKGEH